MTNVRCAGFDLSRKREIKKKKLQTAKAERENEKRREPVSKVSAFDHKFVCTSKLNIKKNLERD